MVAAVTEAPTAAPPIDLASLALTPADLDNLTNEQIAERLDQIQMWAARMRAKVKENKKAERRAPVAVTIGALQTRSNDLVRAQFNHAKITDRLNRARAGYDETLAGYLKANELTELPPDVEAQLAEGRETILAKLRGAASRVGSNGSADEDHDTE